MKRMSGTRAYPFCEAIWGIEKKKMGVQRQRIGNIFCESLMGVLEVSARAVRDIPRMYPPSPSPSKRIRKELSKEVLVNCSQEMREKAAVGYMRARAPAIKKKLEG